MGGVLKALLLPQGQRELVDTTIRRHSYVGLDTMVAALHEAGIDISRSALHRYVSVLKEQDRLFQGDPATRTIVTVVDRKTGGVATAVSEASSSDILSAISALSPSK